MSDSTSELDQFRRRWKEEVSAKNKRAEPRSNVAGAPSRARRPSEPRPERPFNKPPARHPAADIKDESEHDSEAEHPTTQSQLAEQVDSLDLEDADRDEFGDRSTKVPETALEHFERAVEKEDQGNLGESLSHYRKAYKMDAKVDQTYKNKHFAHRWKQSNPNPSNAAPTVPNPAHHSSAEAGEVLPAPELIPTFAGLPIEGAPPMIKGDIPPPCPIARLPAEVLVEMLQVIGTKDPALLARLSLVCKNMAYHIYTENSIWKKLALGPHFGFASQQFQFATDLQGRELIFETLEEDDEPAPPVTEQSFPRSTIWRDVFHAHPRIRFSGVYISTVNYSRPGGASATAHVWSNPIHVVTYYRYLRFFRDGTCISLLTVNEPIDVVPHLTWENLNLVRSKGGATLPVTALPPPPPAGGATQAPPPSAQNIMKHALRGRWRLCHPNHIASANEGTDPTNAAALVPGDLHIETEGAGPRYMYTMHLSLKSTSRSRTAPKNTKLVWKGFWSYNQLSSDWAEFGLRNDKPFYFSRVKRYGLGY
jgi:F-box protein 9